MHEARARSSSRAARPIRGWLWHAPLVLLIPLVGCQCPGAAPPKTAREAMERINANIERVRGAVHCSPARVSARFRDERGAERRFIAQPATLIFDAPRCLLFEIRNELAGPVARIGANDEQYWVWVDSGDMRKLWYGSWSAYERGAAKPTIVDPDGLLDVLMMRPLPESGPAGERPTLRPKGKSHELVFFATDRDRWPYEERIYLLDPCPPYQPLEIIQNLPDGTEHMHAYIGNYRPIEQAGADAAFVPRNLVVYWKQQGSEVRIDFSSVKYRTKTTPFCDFPESWDGDIEALDLNAPPRRRSAVASKPSATQPATRAASASRPTRPPAVSQPARPASRPGAAPTSQPTSRPALVPGTRPTQPATRPTASRPASQPATQPARPASQPSARPQSQPASRPVAPETPPRGRGAAAP